jgi:hypothetical protein
MTETTDKARRGAAWTPAKTTGWQPNRVRARGVGEFLPALMRPAFEKYGFSSASILTDWAALAGPELAAYTAPERLKWPRSKPGEDSKDKSQGGATLILRVVGARALEVEHRRPQIIERLNASFGYRAVAEIRVVQAPIEKRETRKTRTLPAPGALPSLGAKPLDGLETIQEDRLRAAIARLAQGIEARRQEA